MALNSLKVDPGRPWKGVWRWYDESLLDCCKDLREVQLDGISLEEFVCLAVCNGLSCETRRAGSSEMAPPTSVKTCANVSDGCHASITSGSLDDLRTAVKHACGRSDVVLAASYSRKTLGQTGDGHFSPIGGYDAASDQVLLLDVARFKYPPHWVPLPLLLDAMGRQDAATGRPRGATKSSKAVPRLATASFLEKLGVRDRAAHVAKAPRRARDVAAGLPGLPLVRAQAAGPGCDRGVGVGVGARRRDGAGSLPR